MKHGVIISAHNNVEIVRTALRMLDDPRFIFFLHIDAKSKHHPQEFVPELKHASCVMLDRVVLNWGGYSMIHVIFRLMEAAVNHQVDVIHYLQGADLPLKTPDQIDRFLENNSEKNFLNFQPECNDYARYKVLCKHFLVELPWYREAKILHWINHGLSHLQKPFMDPHRKLYHGSSLFTITREFALYVLKQEPEIRREYRYSIAGDEVFLHTIFMNSPYVQTLSEFGNVRLIDWKRREGNSPHTFTMEDHQELAAAIATEHYLFARKFSAYRDLDVVKNIEALICTDR